MTMKKVAGNETNDVAYPSDKAAEFARAKRRAQTAELYLKGNTQALIAEELGVSTHTVERDLKLIMQSWLKDASVKMEERKARELAKIDEIERMAWRGWELSIQRQEVHRSLKETVRQQVRGGDKKVTGHRMVPVKVIDEVVIKGQSGDPRFLEQAARCVEMRLRILGLWKADPKATGQVLLDWAGLFRAQAEAAGKAAEEHARQRLGYGRGLVLDVPARTEGRPSGSAPPEPHEGRDATFPPEMLEEDPIEARISGEERLVDRVEDSSTSEEGQ